MSGVAPSLSSAFVPAESARADLAGHGEHLAPLLECEVGGDQRAAPLACLDDDGRAAEAGDDPVAGREPPRRGLDARRVLGDDQPGRDDPAREVGVRGRVVAVDAAAEHGDGRAAGFECAAVRFGVDPARHAGDDDETRARELAAERARDRRAVAGAGAGADDRDRRTGEQCELALAAEEEPRRRIVDRAQQRRELRRRARQEAEAARGEPLLVGARVEAPQVRRPAPVERRLQQMRPRLGREDGERSSQCPAPHRQSRCLRS